MIEKIFRHVIFPLIIALIIAGCSSKNETSSPDKLVWLWYKQYNTGLYVIQKINDLSYNPISNSIVSAFEPAMVNQANIMKFTYNPKINEKDPVKLDLAKITNGPIRHVRISPDGVYTVFSGTASELIVLKNDLLYKKFDLSDEVTHIEFDEKDKTILAVGDERGKLVVIDLEKSAILNTVQLFDDEITGLAFYKDKQLLVSGNDSRLFQVNIHSGEIVRTIETNGIKEKISHITGIKHCIKDRINKVLYIESEDKIVTTQGWDYCHDFRVNIFDASSGNFIKGITSLKHPVYHIVWVSKLRSLIFVDHGQNLFKLFLGDFSLSTPIYLPGTVTTYDRLPEKDEEIKLNFGNVQSVISIPTTSYLFIGIGSYFKAGPGILLIEITTNSIKNIARLNMGSDGNAHLLVHEELFDIFRVAPW